MSRRSASSLIGTGRSPDRASSASATTAYRDFEVIEITLTFYRTVRPWLGSTAVGRSPPPGCPHPIEGSEAVLSERPHCLVVDVHPLVRLGVRKVLATDFEVQEAAGREEALDLVRDIGDFDVAVLDMGWRRNGECASISGIETIREMHRTSPVLAIVAHDARA